MEMLKTDLSKTDPTYYKASKNPQLVELDTYYYLTISGTGSPDDKLFNEAVEAIYTVAYGIKFLCKAEDNDFTVPKLECHWYIAGGLKAQDKFAKAAKSEWLWQIKIRMPDMVEADHFFRSIHQAKHKKPELQNFDELKFELINEGPCAQILHIGSWDDEPESIRKVHDFMNENNLTVTGYHKEIYITDPRRVAPDKLKTILRYQVSRP